MPLWTDLRNEVFTHTNRPDLVSETDLAVRSALRAAHRAGKFWKDLVVVPINPAVAAIQQIDVATSLPRLRMIAYVKSGTMDKRYNRVDIDDLFDPDGYARVDIYWAMGNVINIKSSTPEESYEIAFYQHPIVSQEGVVSWIADEHREAIVLPAASTVLGITGEQEIKSRVDTLAGVALADLIQDNIRVAE